MFAFICLVSSRNELSRIFTLKREVISATCEKCKSWHAIGNWHTYYSVASSKFPQPEDLCLFELRRGQACVSQDSCPTSRCHPPPSAYCVPIMLTSTRRLNEPRRCQQVSTRISFRCKRRSCQSLHMSHLQRALKCRTQAMGARKASSSTLSRGHRIHRGG